MPTPYPLGVYCGNPNGNDTGANDWFQEQYTKFTNVMGAEPTLMNAFVDFNGEPATWPGSAGWTSWSWKVANKGHLTPVIGIPMSWNAKWYPSNKEFFEEVAQGKYDEAYAGIVQAWANEGFKLLYLRPGYEHPGNFMPWYQGDDDATQAAWVTAFRRISDVMRAAGSAAGIEAKICWNPCSISWSGLQVIPSWPGDAYVDVVGLDTYSPSWPRNLTTWDGNGNPGPDAPNMQDWLLGDDNRRHFWRYPGATRDAPSGDAGWGFADTVDLMRTSGKPLLICECGAGQAWQNGAANPDTGPADDPLFAQWLAENLGGLQVLGVMVWAIDMGDGHWGFLDGQQPEAAKAWAAGFGVAGEAPPVQLGTAKCFDNLGAEATIPLDHTADYYTNDTGLSGNVWVYGLDAAGRSAAAARGVKSSGVPVIHSDNRDLVWKVDITQAGGDVEAVNFWEVIR